MPLAPVAGPPVGNRLASSGRGTYLVSAFMARGNMDMLPRTRSNRRSSWVAHRAIRGFTLVELMVTVAVLAILIAIATPSFTSVINNNRLAGHANEFVATLQLARMEAVRRNARAVVCRSDNGSSCAAGARWNGWIMFVDGNRNGTAEAAELLRVGTAEVPVEIRAGSTVAGSRIVFSPDGLARVTNASGVPQTNLLNTDIGVCIPTRLPAENERRIQLRSGSRLSVERVDSGGTCGVPNP